MIRKLRRQNNPPNSILHVRDRSDTLLRGHSLGLTARGTHNGETTTMIGYITLGTGNKRCAFMMGAGS
mgnify:CR=1 FL=1